MGKGRLCYSIGGPIIRLFSAVINTFRYPPPPLYLIHIPGAAAGIVEAVTAIFLCVSVVEISTTFSKILLWKFVCKEFETIQCRWGIRFKFQNGRYGNGCMSYRCVCYCNVSGILITKQGPRNCKLSHGICPFPQNSALARWFCSRWVHFKTCLHSA